MSLKIKLKMLLKKKEKCLSEYVQISVRGLSKQGLTPSLPTRSGPSARKECWFGPTAPSRAAQHFTSRENAPTTGTPGQAAAHTCRPWARGQRPQAERSGGDMHSCRREAQAQAGPQGRCAAGPSAPAAGRRECTEISPGEALNRYRNLSPRWGLLHRNLESHSPTGSILPTGNHWKRQLIL
uniref:Uncharacterized protein n=1 Tax=Myotis myotis TaxID=51298 RepID=A0A7J7TJW4_MYOMY|nr:hypothetical protein mMyoMyo1_009107 [Myotis myotis]